MISANTDTTKQSDKKTWTLLNPNYLQSESGMMTYSLDFLIRLSYYIFVITIFKLNIFFLENSASQIKFSFVEIYQVNSKWAISPEIWWL